MAVKRHYKKRTRTNPQYRKTVPQFEREKKPSYNAFKLQELCGEKFAKAVNEILRERDKLLVKTEKKEEKK